MQENTNTQKYLIPADQILKLSVIPQMNLVHVRPDAWRVAADRAGTDCWETPFPHIQPHICHSKEKQQEAWGKPSNATESCMQG